MDNYTVTYINLKKRKDRNKRIRNELLKIFDEDKINRFEAIYDINGTIGCAKSHLQVLKNFKKSTYDTLIVFEDDIQWELKQKEVKDYFKKIMNMDFNIVSFIYHIPVINMGKRINNYLSYATNIQMCAGYIIRKSLLII